MESKKAPSPFAVLWGWADGEHGGFYTSVALALLGVACGMVPYFCVAAMIARLLSGGGLVECMPWCAGALVGYLGKALFSTWSTALDLGSFLLGCGVYILVFFVLSVRYLSRRDVTAG